MPQRVIWVRPKDVPLYERAVRFAAARDQSLSHILAKALQGYLAMHDESEPAADTVSR